MALESFSRKAYKVVARVCVCVNGNRTVADSLKGYGDDVFNTKNTQKKLAQK